MSRRPRRTRLLVALVLIAAVVVVVVAVAGGGSSTKHRSAPLGLKASRGAAKQVVAKPKPRIVSGPHDSPVPILMYHVVSTPKPGAPYPDLYTPKPVFAAQMHALARHGYHAVTLAQVFDYWHRGYALPSKPIVLSFDDGYLSHYTKAMPILRSLGWPGVLNLEINNVRPGDLTASQVRGLIAAGWEVDSHTLTHPDLRNVSAAQLRRELVGSRAYLRSHFGVPANFFCYPAGRFDARVVAAVKAAGYRGATTTVPGYASPKSPFTLNRIRVDGADGVSGLLRNVASPASLGNTAVG